MEPDQQRGRAIAQYVREKCNDMWTDWNQGRYEYHFGTPRSDNPNGSSAWDAGWLNEQQRPEGQA